MELMYMFCRDTRHLSPRAAREVWVGARLDAAAVVEDGRAARGWSVTGSLFEPEIGQSDATRRLARYRAMGAGGTAGLEYFRSEEKDLGSEMLRTLLSVAQSDPAFRALTGPDARAERRRVWAP